MLKDLQDDPNGSDYPAWYISLTILMIDAKTLVKLTSRLLHQSLSVVFYPLEESPPRLCQPEYPTQTP